MQNERECLKNDNQSQPQPESMISIQLLPQPSALQLQDSTCTYTKDKRPSAFASVNNFIKKTYAILQEKRFDSIVGWADSEHAAQGPDLESPAQREKTCRDHGLPSSFKIHNLRAFEQIVLPQYFKHSNMSSFVRQLNMYNFHKVRGDKDEIEFEHEKFKRNRPELLPEIRRKQVESTVSISSIALIPIETAGDHEREAVKQTQKEPDHGTVQVLPEQFESPLKRESSQGREQESTRLRELLELNKTLKRQKQIKSNQLKQLTNEAKINMGNKFSKSVLAMVAAKMQQDLAAGKEDVPTLPENSFSNIHQMIGHIMDSATPLAFKDLMDQTSRLFQSQPTHLPEEA